MRASANLERLPPRRSSRPRRIPQLVQHPPSPAYHPSARPRPATTKRQMVSDIGLHAETLGSRICPMGDVPRHNHPAFIMLTRDFAREARATSLRPDAGRSRHHRRRQSPPRIRPLGQAPSDVVATASGSATVPLRQIGHQFADDVEIQPPGNSGAGNADECLQPSVVDNAPSREAAEIGRTHAGRRWRSDFGKGETKDDGGA